MKRTRWARGSEFVRMGIDSETRLGRRLDVVHCRTFYPFVRTADAAIHHAYFTFCVNHLNRGGTLVLALAYEPETIVRTIEHGEIDYSALRLTAFEKTCAPRQLRNRLPIPLASMLGHALYRATIEHIG